MWSLLLLVPAAVCLWLSARHFRQKGFLWNNAWLFASSEERKSMDKAPHYRQSAVVFAFLGVIFLLLAGELYWHTGWLPYLTVAAIVGVAGYAMFSSVRTL